MFIDTVTMYNVVLFWCSKAKILNNLTEEDIGGVFFHVITFYKSKITLSSESRHHHQRRTRRINPPPAVLRWRILNQIPWSSQIKIVFAGILFFSSTLDKKAAVYCDTVGCWGLGGLMTNSPPAPLSLSLPGPDHAQMPRPENTRLW